MKRIVFLLALTATLGMSLPSLRAEYKVPSEGRIDQMMANPNLVAATLKGADATQAATLLKRMIDRLMGADLNDSQRSFLIAYFTARFTFLLPASELNAFANALIPLIPPQFVTSVLAGFSLGGRGSAGFILHVLELVQENDPYVQALLTPRSALANPIYDQLVISLAASQSLPPSVTDSLPPPIPVGTGTDAGSEGPGALNGPQAPPPIPEPYEGQS